MKGVGARDSLATIKETERRSLTKAHTGSKSEWKISKGVVFVFVFIQPALGLKVKRVFIIFSSQCTAVEVHYYDGLQEPM